MPPKKRGNLGRSTPIAKARRVSRTDETEEEADLMLTSRNDVLKESSFETAADWSVSHGRRFRANNGPGQVLVIVQLSVLMVKVPYRPKRAFLTSPSLGFVDTPSTTCCQ